MQVVLYKQTPILTVSFPGQPWYAGTRKKPFWILVKQEIMWRLSHQLDRTSLQTDSHASTLYHILRAGSSLLWTHT